MALIKEPTKTSIGAELQQSSPFTAAFTAVLKDASRDR